MSSDRIEKRVMIKAPRERVWRAIADPQQFGAWFGMKIDGAFTPGARVHARITDPPEYSHVTFDFTVEQIEPERLFSYRWVPYAIDTSVDYSGEPTTLVELRLADVPEGTELTLVESGFDQVPLARRAEAFRMNDGGWAVQVENIRRYVEG
jgi:uncharacterized protein YndB with AHSA1/START domain